MSTLGLILYIILQVAFLPLALVGVMLVAYRQIVVSKRLGISQTAIEVLNGRWTMHIFDIRADRASAELAATLPNTSLTGLWLCLFPLWLKYKISGKLFLYPRIPALGEENLGDLVTARTLYFDRIIERVLGEVEQFVIMGAGYDTRAYGCLQRGDVTAFELDQEVVQNHKRKAIADAGIPSDHVHFVTVDFSHDNVFEKLSQAGYDSTRRTLFLWEGVTLYLSEFEVRKTMHDIQQQAQTGSVLLADLYSDRMVKIGKNAATKKVLDYTDEGFGFSLDLSDNYEETLTNFVESESLSVGESFFMGHSNDKGPFMVVAEMKC
jgi:methyltransferase (TIGR00027 family)